MINITLSSQNTDLNTKTTTSNSTNKQNRIVVFHDDEDDDVDVHDDDDDRFDQNDVDGNIGLSEAGRIPFRELYICLYLCLARLMFSLLRHVPDRSQISLRFFSSSPISRSYASTTAETAPIRPQRSIDRQCF